MLETNGVSSGINLYNSKINDNDLENVIKNVNNGYISEAEISSLVNSPKLDETQLNNLKSVLLKYKNTLDNSSSKMSDLLNKLITKIEDKLKNIDKNSISGAISIESYSDVASISNVNIFNNAQQINIANEFVKSVVVPNENENRTNLVIADLLDKQLLEPSVEGLC